MINRLGPSYYSGFQHRLTADDVLRMLTGAYKVLIDALASYGNQVAENIKNAPEKIKNDLKNFGKEYEALPPWAKTMVKNYLKGFGIDIEVVIQVLDSIEW